MVNRPGGRRGFENRWCRKAWASSAPAIRQPEGQPAGRSASVGSGLDAQALWIKTTAFRHGESIRAAPDPRSKRVSGASHGDRHVGSPPILCRPQMYRRRASKMRSLATFQQGGPGPRQSHKLLKADFDFRPCNQFRAGWALVSPTLCKSAVHSEVVRIHPCPPNSRP